MSRSWTVADFILVWLGGFLGTGIFLALGLVFEREDVALVLGLAGQYIGNLGVLWLLRSRKEEGDLGFVVEPGDIAYVGLGLVLQLALALLFLPLAQLLFPEGRPVQELAEVIADTGTSTLLKFSLIGAAVVLAPITEELVFRGVLLRALERRGRRVMIAGSAAVFSAVHILGLQFDRIWASAAVVLPPIFILGVLLAWITLRKGRLGPAILIHSGWNLLAALILVIPPDALEGLG